MNRRGLDGAAGFFGPLPSDGRAVAQLTWLVERGAVIDDLNGQRSWGAGYRQPAAGAALPDNSSRVRWFTVRRMRRARMWPDRFAGVNGRAIHILC